MQSLGFGVAAKFVRGLPARLLASTAAATSATTAASPTTATAAATTSAAETATAAEAAATRRHGPGFVHRKRSAAAGFNEHLVKPVTMDQLSAIMAGVRQHA